MVSSCCAALSLRRIIRSRKRKRQRQINELDLQLFFFVDVTAPAEQAVRFTETSPDESQSGWRAGYCQYPAEDFLETAVPQLLAWELDNVPVTIRASNNASVAGNVLTASRALKEGEVVMTARCLTFSDATMVAQFMNSGGNGALLEGPLIAVRGVEGCDGDGATTFMDVHCVLVGLARMIKDYRGLRKRPNVAFRARPERGANDGFLEVVVSTPNAVGIGANSEIVANFGEHYVPSSEVYNPSAKKFKGALDLLLESKPRNPSSTMTPPRRTMTPPRRTLSRQAPVLDQPAQLARLVGSPQPPQAELPQLARLVGPTPLWRAAVVGRTWQGLAIKISRQM